MKSSIYRTLLIVWIYLPLKKQLLFILKFFGVDYNKFIRDVWFDTKFKVNFGDAHFYLQANRYDKGMLEIFYQGLDKSWDAKSIELWYKLAKRSTNIFDIGANFGLYALAAKAANPASHVFAFEPSKYALQLLKQNVAANNFDITIGEVALSNKNGEMNFYECKESSASSSFRDDDANSRKEKTNVKTQLFSDFIKAEKIDRVDLISIDVELHEPEVLEGMGDVISKYTPDFIIEVLNNEIGSMIEHFFTGYEYLFFEINEKEMKVTQQVHLTRNIRQNHSFNYLICKPESAKALKLDFHL